MAVAATTRLTPEPQQQERLQILDSLRDEVRKPGHEQDHSKVSNLQAQYEAQR